MLSAAFAKWEIRFVRRSLVLLFIALFGLIVFRVEAQEIRARYSLQQPSFEKKGEQGGPLGWKSLSKRFTLDFSNSRRGKASLKWSNNDPTQYVLCSQKTQLRPGDFVEYSVWIKTENVRNGRATICLEWSDKNGKWLGTSYADGLEGTVKNWTLVKHRTRIPDGAHNISVLCFVTKRGIGTAWFDDVQLRPYFITAVTTDQYRHQSTGDLVYVRAGFNPIPERARPRVIPGLLDLYNEQGHRIQSIESKTTGKDFVEFELNTKPLPVGKYKMTVRLLDPVIKKEDSFSLFLTRLDHFPKRKSYIDMNRRLILDDRPFFPLGLYFITVSQRGVDQLANSPFNCIMPYDAISREILDALDQKNIKVIYSVKDYYSGMKVKTHQEGLDITKKTIKQLKDHPAIIAWYINDELPINKLKMLSDRRDLVEELDPGRPTWSVLYQIDDIRDYLPSFDIVGTDPYPVGRAPLSQAYDWSRKTNEAVFRYHATWQVPQIFNWAGYKKTKELMKGFRAPNFEEMRGMAWMNIAGGANGLVFFSFFDLRRMDKTIEEGGCALVREPFDPRWKDVCRMGREIAEWIPVLLAVDPPIPVKPASDSDPEIVWRLFGNGPDTWLLIVNSAEKAKTARFEIPEGASLTETKLGSPAEVHDQKITLKLAPLEPRFLRIQRVKN